MVFSPEYKLTAQDRIMGNLFSLLVLPDVGLL